jgi:hypothetical protein
MILGFILLLVQKMNMKKVAFLVLGMMISGVAVSAEWHTSYKNDEMRGTAQKFSQTESDNAVDFDFPYNGGSKLTIVLRSKKTELKAGQKPESLPLTEAIIVISKGQFSCNSYDGCHVSAKFDDGKIQGMQCLEQQMVAQMLFSLITHHLSLRTSKPIRS